jgi:predicted ATP-dependent serine protease
MSRNPFIIAKLQKICDNAAQRKHDKRVNVIDKKQNLYTAPINNRTFSPEEMNLFKREYQKQVKLAKQKNLIVLIITIVATPLVCYLLVQFFFSDWFLF